jgi:hypothetical protein
VTAARLALALLLFAAPLPAHDLPPYDRDPAAWIPPYLGAHCGYGRVWVAVKARYELDVDGEELAALVGLLATCEAMP